MRKKDELSNKNSCMSKALPNEMMFILLGRDPAASATIRYWVETRILQGKNKPGDPEMLEAIQCADTMAVERGSEKL